MGPQTDSASMMAMLMYIFNLLKARGSESDGVPFLELIFNKVHDVDAYNLVRRRRVGWVASSSTTRHLVVITAI